MKKKKAAPRQENSLQNDQRHCSRGSGGSSSRPPMRRRQTKTERAYMLIISSPHGVTENDILRNCHLSSGRNYANLLEKAAQIHLKRIPEPNPDGIGSHYRYQIRSAQDAFCSAMVISKLMMRRGASPLSEDEVRSLTRPYDTSAPHSEGKPYDTWQEEPEVARVVKLEG